MAVSGKTQNSGVVSGPGTLGGGKAAPAYGTLDWQVQNNWITPEAAAQQGAINNGGWGAPAAPAAPTSTAPLANGATNRGSTPMQQWQQSTTGMQPQQPQQPIVPTNTTPKGPAPYIPVDQLKTSLAAQVASKGINQGQADAEIARVQGLWDEYNKSGGASTGFDQAAQIANTQGQINNQNMQQQAQYNRVNEFNPYGQSEFRQNPDGSYSRISSLSPEQQGLLDSQQQRDATFSGGMGGLAASGVANLQQPFNYGAMPKALGMEDLQGDRRRVEDQVYGQYSGDIEREAGQQLRAFEQKMANQGIPQGSEMYNSLMDNFNRTKGDALNRARTSAIATGRQETESMFDMGDRSRSRGISEAKDLRYMPLDEVARLGALSGGVQNPQFSATSQIQSSPVDFGGYAQNFMGQDYGLGVYKNKAGFDQNMSREQYLWQKQQEEQGKGGGGGSSGGGGGSWY